MRELIKDTGWMVTKVAFSPPWGCKKRYLLFMVVDLKRGARMVAADDFMVCNLTGHGLKQPAGGRLRDEEMCPIPTQAGSATGANRR
jgi:hypothetical protein